LEYDDGAMLVPAVNGQAMNKMLGRGFRDVDVCGNKRLAIRAIEDQNSVSSSGVEVMLLFMEFDF